MTRTFFIVFCLLISAGGFAQKIKTINNPYYEFKSTGLTNISRIELSKEETRVYIHNTFLPNWWVMFTKDDALIDSDTQKQYKVKSIEGAKFDKKLWMPASGDSTIVLIFPPLDKKTKSVDYSDKIFGISLNEDLAGMKPNHTVPFEIEQWMSAELAKCTQEPISNYKGDDFFTQADARLIGYIKGYSPKSGVKSGVVYLDNYLTREDYPIVIEIEKDGRFDVTLSLISPIYSTIQYGKRGIRFYLEPNQTLGMIIDWEEILLADRLRDRRYKFQNIAYKGKLAKVNYDLMRYNFERELNFNVTNYKRKKKLSEEEKIAEINKEKLIELNKLDYYSSIWKWSDKADEIIKNKILLQHATDMFDIVMRSRSEAFKKKKYAQLQKTRPDSFYTFLKELPWSEPSLCINEEFKWFINRFEFSHLLTQYRKHDSVKGNKPPNFYTFLLENEPMLTDDDRKLLELNKKKIKTEEEQVYLKEHGQDFKELRFNYNKAFDQFNAFLDVYNFKSDPQRWSLASSAITDKYGIDLDLTMEIVKLRSLKYKFENTAKEDSKEIWVDIKKTLENQSLIVTGEKLYEKYYGTNVTSSYQLPEGKATDIFNKIIEPHKGKILFVDFWATFCGPCISSIKRMKEVRESYEGNEDIDFVFITDESGSPQNKYDEFVADQELKNTYRISADDYLYLRQLFKFNGIPRYVVIGKDGKVIDDNFRMHQFKSKVNDIVAKENKLLTGN
ncbi:TlpA family protein disulfide reductase [Carboxylicivirga sp. RSCT41]|uniref:TlpA family protein disulfide reductase n=1 Tax=Carboxylicivirga agarovorans TaxID=3417570 RepID=UPI003D343291